MNERIWLFGVLRSQADFVTQPRCIKSTLRLYPLLEHSSLPLTVTVGTQVCLGLHDFVDLDWMRVPFTFYLRYQKPAYAFKFKPRKTMPMHGWKKL